MGSAVTWGSIIIGLITALSSLIAWLRERNMLKTGEAEAAVKALKEQASELERANKAREEARQRSNAVPSDSSLPDDGFQRSTTE